MGRPPFTTWSDTDHSGAVIITTVLGLIYWLVPGISQQALSIGQSSLLSWADGLYIASMIMGIAQATLLLVACSYGLGRSIKVLQNGQIAESMRLYHASNILYILILGSAKCSATSSVVKLTVPGRGSIRSALTRHKMIFGVVTTLSVVWMVGSVITIGLQCEVGSNTFALQRSSCGGTLGTWVGIFIADAVTDLTIAGFAASIIWPTRARMRLKLVWYMPYTIRFCIIAVSGVRLAVYQPVKLARDPTIALWLFAVLSQVQIFITLVAAGFPALRKAVLDLTTNFGVSEDSANRSQREQGYSLSSATGKSKQRRTRNSSSAFVPYTGGEGTTDTVIRAGTDANASDDDNSQTGIVRQDEVDITVTFLDSRGKSDMRT